MKNYGNTSYKHIIGVKIFLRSIHQCLLYVCKNIEGNWEKEVIAGHFAVVAVKCEKPKRFVVELRCLSNPVFLRLLKKAGEEYGFKHEGAIAIPCEPHELQLIIQEMRER
ncbi:hypothetical protein L2E82_28292 [Cichorium intybus]|uniref:Uncharacterized protein n=1 Tax=Cichorium intybus TaxID=13427 RepID=A0ACB9CVB7_CICIN|nr:hypothetical protein L2E82_28292 [Cichorium intybus]